MTYQNILYSRGPIEDEQDESRRESEAMEPDVAEEEEEEEEEEEDDEDDDDEQPRKDNPTNARKNEYTPYTSKYERTSVEPKKNVPISKKDFFSKKMSEVWDSLSTLSGRISKGLKGQSDKDRKLRKHRLNRQNAVRDKNRHFAQGKTTRGDGFHARHRATAAERANKIRSKQPDSVTSATKRVKNWFNSLTSKRFGPLGALSSFSPAGAGYTLLQNEVD